MAVRRVITGQNRAGKSIIVSDEIVEAGADYGPTFISLWGADEPPSFPQSGIQPRRTRLFPGPGGYHFFTITLAPNSQGTPTAEEMATMSPDIQENMEADAPGMHTTDTVDLAIVVAGEASLEFDDGAVVHLRAGDYLVQNGTRHRWFNRGSVTAVVAGVIIGGHPRANADSSH